MSAPARQELPEVNHPVRWLPSAWERIKRAADVLTVRDHLKTNPVDVIRTGTLRYVDEVLGDEQRQSRADA